MIAAGRVGVRGVMVVAASFLVGLVAPAGASAIACGDAITTDVQLTEDLDCSAYADTALRLRRDGVTLDLNGHTLTGPTGERVGVDSGWGLDDLTVENGTIEGFSRAVVLRHNDDVRITGLTIDLGGASARGVSVYDGRHLHISNVHVRHGMRGFDLVRIEDQALLHSKVTGANTDVGVLASDPRGRIDDVQVKGAKYGFLLEGPSRRRSADLKVTDSTASDGGIAGFQVVTHDPDATFALSHNIANDNRRYGFFAAFRRADGHGNEARGNGIKNCVRVPCVG